MNLTRAYIASGYGGRGHVAESGGSRLMSYGEVQMRVDELTRPAVRKARITIESLLAEPEITIADAREAKQHGAVIQALTLAAKVAGFLRERIEVSAVGEFASCHTTDDVARKMLEDWPLDQALRVLDEIRDALVRVASDKARVVTA